jgi:hypothetical protein
MIRSAAFRDLAGVAAVFAALAVGSARARADVVPTKRDWKPCTAPGQPCETEGWDEQTETLKDTEAGTCVAATRIVQVRNRDGGTTPVPVPAFKCVAVAKGSKSKPTSRSSGCAVAPERGNPESPALTVSMSMLAGLMLVVARRRNAGE